MPDYLKTLFIHHQEIEKFELLVEYYKQTNDPDRGFAVALITNSLKLSSIRSTNLKQIIKSKVDPYSL